MGFCRMWVFCRSGFFFYRSGVLSRVQSSNCETWEINRHTTDMIGSGRKTKTICLLLVVFFSGARYVKHCKQVKLVYGIPARVSCALVRRPSRTAG